MPNSRRNQDIASPEPPDAITYRPSAKEKHILARLSEQYGISWTRLIGLTVRRMGEAEGIVTEGGERTHVEVA